MLSLVTRSEDGRDVDNAEDDQQGTEEVDDADAERR